MSPPPLPRRLLVAAPSLADPNFARTVTLLLHHDADGAVGVVLSRPSQTPLAEVLPQWSPLASEPSLVHVGGPVQPDAAICLARVRDASGPGWLGIGGDLGTLDLERDPDSLAGLEAMRVFAGYAGWAGGQLEDEIEQGAWYLLDGRPTDPFAESPQRLWHDVLRRQGGRLAMFATMPVDPTLN